MPNSEPPDEGGAIGPRQDGPSRTSTFMDRVSTDVNMEPLELGRGSPGNIDQPKQERHLIEEMSTAPSRGANHSH